MEKLPKELLLDIFTRLPHGDQLSISKTCRSFAQLVKRLLFSFLSFNGEAQVDCDDYANGTGQPVRRCGRKRTVDIAQLDAAVDEITSLEITPYVKTFKFCPASYAPGKPGDCRQADSGKLTLTRFLERVQKLAK
jgi:hypothetical protein